MLAPTLHSAESMAQRRVSWSQTRCPRAETGLLALMPRIFGLSSVKRSSRASESLSLGNMVAVGGACEFTLRALLLLVHLSSSLDFVFVSSRSSSHRNSHGEALIPNLPGLTPGGGSALIKRSSGGEPYSDGTHHFFTSPFSYLVARSHCLASLGRTVGTKRAWVYT